MTHTNRWNAVHHERCWRLIPYRALRWNSMSFNNSTDLFYNIIGQFKGHCFKVRTNKLAFVKDTHMSSRRQTWCVGFKLLIRYLNACQTPRSSRRSRWTRLISSLSAPARLTSLLPPQTRLSLAGLHVSFTWLHCFCFWAEIQHCNRSQLITAHSQWKRLVLRAKKKV